MLGTSGVAGVAVRLVMGSFGAFFVNGPLFRLPENLGLDASLRLLDVGCGRGSVMRVLNDRMHFDRAPVGLDFSSEVLRLADRDERRSGRPSRLTRGAATALPFADASFDLVTCGYMVRLLSDDELRLFFEELRRVLAVGGLALLWEYGTTGNAHLDSWNSRVLGVGGTEPRLRSTRSLLQSAELAGFEFFRDAQLRPFLFPPIPRASILIGTPPGAL
jgi:cyclopropane fatty-acyl-phospholipid synthase-like methyltransferase